MLLDVPVRDAPLIVLSYPFSGAERLRSLLAPHPGLACTMGTGVLPLCEQAAVTWRFVGGQDDQLSPVATASVRSLVSGIVTCLLARTGKRRWCEFVATTTLAMAEVFRQVWPGVRFVCLHRACADVIRASLQASEWGLASSAFAQFTTAYPGNTAAALTAYWVARTQPLLDFEEAHPESCFRIRYEELGTYSHVDDLFKFLDLKGTEGGVVGPAGDSPLTRDEATTGFTPRSPFPVSQIPFSLLTQADDLMSKLGYPPLSSEQRNS